MNYVHTVFKWSLWAARKCLIALLISLHVCSISESTYWQHCAFSSGQMCGGGAWVNRVLSEWVCVPFQCKFLYSLNIFTSMSKGVWQPHTIHSSNAGGSIHSVSISETLWPFGISIEPNASTIRAQHRMDSYPFNPRLSCLSRSPSLPTFPYPATFCITAHLFSLALMKCPLPAAVQFRLCGYPWIQRNAQSASREECGLAHHSLTGCRKHESHPWNICSRLINWNEMHSDTVQLKRAIFKNT